MFTEKRQANTRNRTAVIERFKPHESVTIYLRKWGRLRDTTQTRTVKTLGEARRIASEWCAETVK